MKKHLLMVTLLAIAVMCLSGCGNSMKTATAQKLSFAESVSIDSIKALDGKPVTITGYMATLSPLNGDYIYLMNLPYQSCPFCVPNTQQLANTMAVYAAKGTKFDYTDRPVKITGRMELGDFTDEYGYTYNYRLADAGYELLFVCQWTEYQGSGVDGNGQQITYYLYPGDVENILVDDGDYGYAAQANEDYFPGLISRVKNVGGDSLTELTEIIDDAQDLEQDARNELGEQRYSYDEAADKYILDNSDELYNRFYEIYGRFSQWLTKYEL